MSLDHLLWYIIIGFVAGWLASRIMRKTNLGLIGNIVIGILGAVVGGYVFNTLHISTQGLVGSLVTATAGAVILLYLIGLAKKI
ncbi:MAG: GlsB/YeaQ/YmgE family stress response membrane protein [Anaerolineales bacterium]